MRIVVCVKYVPDAAADRSFDPGDFTVDRTGVAGILSELDEHAIEAALVLAENNPDVETIALTVGPAGASEAIKKALQLGIDSGVHVSDEAVHGSDPVATSLVLAKAVEQLDAEQPVDIVLCGMASTDGGMSVVPAMLAERLDRPQATFAASVELADGMLRIRRDGEIAIETVEVTLPAVVSVTDQCNEPRYAAFKGIMAARKKPVRDLSLADLGVPADQVGLAASWTTVESTAARPPRQQGTVVEDDGDGGRRLVEFLAERKLA